MIPEIDTKALIAGDPEVLAMVRAAAEDIGFMTIVNTPFSSERMQTLLQAYHRFFRQPETAKQSINMAATGSNRGWGAAGSEQVDPNANPDYKQVFDCGFELKIADANAPTEFYAPNLWPADMAGFRVLVETYYEDACAFAFELLRSIAIAIGEPAEFFDDKFDRPMALLRGNYYPTRPEWAGENDFGIATHTDYGCLTLLATDGSPGLEVRKRGGGWIPVSATPGDFVINFGEMLEMWTAGRVKATPHRVVGTNAERISIPLFFNPNFDTNVAPVGSDDVILAGDHISKRFNETYVHLNKDD